MLILMTNKLIWSRGRLVQWKNVRFVKFFVRGDRGSNLAERIYLFRRVRERKRFDGNFQRNRTSYILSRNLDAKKLLPINSTV